MANVQADPDMMTSALAVQSGQSQRASMAASVKDMEYRLELSLSGQKLEEAKQILTDLTQSASAALREADEAVRDEKPDASKLSDIAKNLWAKAHELAVRPFVLLVLGRLKTHCPIRCYPDEGVLDVLEMSHTN
jgi:hypothetical protein